MVAEHVLKSEMTIADAVKILERMAGAKMKTSKDMGVEKMMDAEARRKQENIPDLNIDADVVRERLSDIPENLRDDAAIAREIEEMEEEHLGKDAIKWELMHAALHGSEDERATFKNPDLTISQAVIALQGRVNRGDRGKSLQLLQKLEELTAMRLLKRSITIPQAIAFLKLETAKEPKLRKIKEQK
jgi:hypothetical protein